MMRKKHSKRLITGLKNVENHITELTGMENHFSFMVKSRSEIAVFRRLSFILYDELSMIRLRLLNEVEPLVQNSVMSGLYIGDITIDKEGQIAEPLNINQVKLLCYLLNEPMGAYPVVKKGSGCFNISYPGDFVEILLGNAKSIIKKAPEIYIKDFQWHIEMPGIHMCIGRFREFCEIQTDEDLFLDIINAFDDERTEFKRLSFPSLLYAFSKTIDVSGLMRFIPQTASQISGRVLRKLFNEYEKVKDEFLSNVPLKNSLRCILPEITGFPKIDIFQPKYFVKRNAAEPRLKLSVKIPAGANNRLYKEIVKQQYLYLKDCCLAQPVKGKRNGKTYTGIISKVDPAIYPPVWSVDHFFNTMAMADFDIITAKKMLIGGLIYFMQQTGMEAGSLPVKKVKNRKGTTYPIWLPVAAIIYNKDKDIDFLKSALPLLELHNDYINRVFLRDGIYTGMGGFWNDYSTGPKKNTWVAGIGMNSLIALEKKLLAVFAAEIGIDNTKYKDEYENLVKKINELFWDEKIGFYFDYDTEKGRIFNTASSGHFWGLDNILPLLSGLVPEERAKRMEKYLLSSDYYGKYPAITTDLSPDFMDERRLMVWIMTNWLVIQGLNCYGMNSSSNAISLNIFNALLKSWTKFRCLPEAMSATHELYQMENPNIAGVGSWAGFYLYLKEIYFKDESSTEFYQQVRTNFK